MELKAGYKQTEVGVIPEDWDMKAISHVAPLQRGFDLPNREIEPGLYPIVYSNGISGTNKTAMVKGPGVVTGRSGTLGKIHFVACDYWPHNTSLWVTRFNSNSPKFIYYLYEAIGFGRFASGSGVPTLNRNDAHSYQVALPKDLKEQEAIAEALSDADALIESLDQLITKKRHLKQGAMQELLTGKRRLPGFSGEWKVKRLGEIATIQRGASPRPIDSPIWFDNNSSIGWVRISDVTLSSIFLKETTQRLSPLGVQHSRPVSRNSLIMSICATVGRPVITEIDTCIHDGFVVFDNLGVEQRFLYYFLKFIENDWARHGQTGSQMNLNTPMINRTAIPVPSVSEQTAIATLLSDMDSELAELESRLAKARHIKQGMMQELLTGRIRLLLFS